MRSRSPRRSRIGNVFGSFLGFFLSALLGLAFVGAVNKAHALFSGKQCTQTATWLAAKNFARRAIGS
ncbi:MAG TPA: hypothetical protein VN643_06740 [Pyrinomonadaceae bacterium]|nr:hypothetical protein [Pyrinomonadaceae bacterium]